MATVTITVPNGVVARVQTAFGKLYNYQATLPNGQANPENITQFTQRMVRQYVLEVVKAAEANTAADAARQSAINQVSTDIVLT